MDGTAPSGLLQRIREFLVPSSDPERPFGPPEPVSPVDDLVDPAGTSGQKLLLAHLREASPIRAEDVDGVAVEGTL
jgi:hypothetical protein